jgi:hypothetical protein
MRTLNFSKPVHRPKVVKMLLAVPLDVRTWLEEKSVLDLMPMTSVVVTALRAQMNMERREQRADKAMKH